MDGPPAQALGLEPADPALTTGKPRSTRQKLLNKGVVARILANATLVSFFLNSFKILGIQKLEEQKVCQLLIIVIQILCGTFFILTRELGDGKLTDRERTMTFTCFVVFDMMNAMACRSQTRSVFDLPPNKPLYIAVSLSLLGQGILFEENHS